MHNGRTPPKNNCCKVLEQRLEVVVTSESRDGSCRTFSDSILSFTYIFDSNVYRKNILSSKDNAEATLTVTTDRKLSFKCFPQRYLIIPWFFWGGGYCNKSFGIVNTALYINFGFVVCYCNEATDWYFCRPAMLQAAILFPSRFTSCFMYCLVYITPVSRV